MIKEEHNAVLNVVFKEVEEVSMNRQQRRAQSKKKKGPAPVNKNEARKYINSLIQKDPKVQEAILEEARRINLLEAQKQQEDIDVMILMTLHECFGFGKTRLLRFAKGLVKVHKYYLDRYEDSDIYAMKSYLKDKVGLDVEKLEEEILSATEESPD